LLSLSVTCKTFRAQITTDVVVKAAMIHGGQAMTIIRDLSVLVNRNAAYMPPTLWLLRMVNGGRCEFCRLNETTYMRPHMALFACQWCHNYYRLSQRPILGRHRNPRFLVNHCTLYPRPCKEFQQSYRACYERACKVEPERTETRRYERGVKLAEDLKPMLKEPWREAAVLRDAERLNRRPLTFWSPAVDTITAAYYMHPCPKRLRKKDVKKCAATINNMRGAVFVTFYH
jgi:hypothetical protein